MLTACKTTSNINEVVFGKEKGVELLGVEIRALSKPKNSLTLRPFFMKLG